MLPREQRLKRTTEFRSTVRTGIRKKAGSFVLYRKQVDGELSRVGFIVGKDVGNAVTRHRLTRQLRHVVKELPPSPQGSNTVVRCLPGAENLDFDQIKKSLSSIW